MIDSIFEGKYGGFLDHTDLMTTDHSNKKLYTNMFKWKVSTIKILVSRRFFYLYLLYRRFLLPHLH